MTLEPFAQTLPYLWEHWTLGDWCAFAFLLYCLRALLRGIFG